jgi:hypothetical protein
MALCERFDTSSATIRAEMAALEAIGYIMQPHISAGRVPTDKGYRAYVNALTEPGTTPPRAGPGPPYKIGRRDRARHQKRRRIARPRHLQPRPRHHRRQPLPLRHGQPLPAARICRRRASLRSGPPARQPRRMAGKEAAPNAPISVYIGRENPIGRSSAAPPSLSAASSRPTRAAATSASSAPPAKTTARSSASSNTLVNYSKH